MQNYVNGLCCGATWAQEWRLTLTKVLGHSHLCREAVYKPTCCEIAHGKSWAWEYAWALTIKSMFLVSELENMNILNFQVFCCACTKINTSLRNCTSPLFQYSGFSRKGNLIVGFWLMQMLLLFLDAHRSEWEKANVWKLQGGRDSQAEREGSCGPLVGQGLPKSWFRDVSSFLCTSWILKLMSQCFFSQQVLGTECRTFSCITGVQWIFFLDPEVSRKGPFLFRVLILLFYDQLLCKLNKLHLLSERQKISIIVL